MKKLFFFSLTVMLAWQCAAQNDPSYTYSGEGVFYKVFKTGTGPAIPYGSYIQFSMEQLYNDSMLFDMRDRKMIMSIDSTVVPRNYFDAMRNINVGDSIIYKISTDSTMPMYAAMPWVTPGNFFVTRFKMEKLFTDKTEAVNASQQIEKENRERDSIKAAAIAALDAQKIERSLLVNNIKFIRSPGGTYIHVAKRGTGPNPGKNSTVLVNYTGRTLDGKVFDSNTDPQFGHVQPYEVHLTNTPVIQGWKDGLLYFNKGAKGTLYIPSALAYGPAGRAPLIGPDEILIFEVEVVDVKGAAPKPATKPATKPSTKPKTKS